MAAVSEEKSSTGTRETKKGKEEVLDYFLGYLSTDEDPTLLIYAVRCTEGVESRQRKVNCLTFDPSYY